jgi:hypothetical protein
MTVVQLKIEFQVYNLGGFALPAVTTSRRRELNPASSARFEARVETAVPRTMT